MHNSGQTPGWRFAGKRRTLLLCVLLVPTAHVLVALSIPVRLSRAGELLSGSQLVVAGRFDWLATRELPQQSDQCLDRPGGNVPVMRA